MAYYGIIPYPVRKSKKISSDEKLLYTDIAASLNDKGFCDKPNTYFVSRFNDVSERTIIRWLNNLQEQNFITKVYAGKKRRIYLKRFIDEFMDEPYPEVYSAKQKLFKTAFPTKEIDIDNIPNEIDMELLIKKINESQFLKEAKNVSLKSCIKNYDAIIKDTYKDIEKLIKQKVVINGKTVTLQLTEQQLKELNQIKAEKGFIPEEVLKKYI